MSYDQNEVEPVANHADISLRVKRLIVKALDLQVKPEEIPDDEAIFGGGLGLDSIATLEIVFAMEDEFGLEVEDDELQADLFDSVEALSKYVKRKLLEHRAISP